jgi:predicted AAA+ superfamily ATPase
MIKRTIEHAIRSAMTDTPVVRLNGARQTGKTTLVLAASDPVGFIRPASVSLNLAEAPSVDEPVASTWMFG